MSKNLQIKKLNRIVFELLDCCYLLLLLQGVSAAYQLNQSRRSRGLLPKERNVAGSTVYTQSVTKTADIDLRTDSLLVLLSLRQFSSSFYYRAEIRRLGYHGNHACFSRCHNT